MTQIPWGCLLLASLVGAMPTRVSAQAADTTRAHSRTDFSFGVSINSPKDVNQRPQCVTLNLPCETPKTFPDGGLVVQAALNASARVALVAEASIYNNGWDTLGVDTGLTNHVSALAAGPRLVLSEGCFCSSVDAERYRLFVQFLGGLERSTVLPTRFALQPGAGLDIKLSPPALWVRVAFDYRRTQGGPRNLSGDRISLAVAVAPPARH